MSLEIVTIARPLSMRPRITAFSERFWNGLADGVFATTCCEGCGRLSFPPRPFCPHCWQEPVSWRTLSGRGTLYAHTTVHAAPECFADELPYTNCIVDLMEGLRVACRLHSRGAFLPPPDSPVRLVVLAYEDGCLFGASAE